MGALTPWQLAVSAFFAVLTVFVLTAILAWGSRGGQEPPRR